MSTKYLVRLVRYFHALIGFSLVILVLYIGINSFVLTTFRVDGMSMFPTLKNRQLLLVNLTQYLFMPPAQDDIVIVAYEGDPHMHFVKRVVGVPGSKVTYQSEDLLLGAGQYFVEGDNRDHSTDSRVYGPVKREYILGKVVYALPF